MSRKVRITICCVLALFAFGAGIFAYAQTYSGKVKEANAVDEPEIFFVDKDGKIEVPTGPNTGNVDTRGTEDNPFFVLEIVPYDGMAQIGFLIDGQEPIDVHAAARDGVSIPGQASIYNVTSKTFYYWLTDAPATFPRSAEIPKTRQYGVMKRVADGTGKYKRVETKDAENNVTAVAYEADSNGNFTWTPLAAETCVTLSYDYSQKMAYDAEYDEIMEPADTIGTEIKMYFDEVEYLSNSGNVLEHKNAFLKESVGLAYRYDSNGVRYRITDEAEIDARVADYHTVVYTVTPEDLNLNLDLIDRADLIVISTQATMLETPNGGSHGPAILTGEVDGISLIDPSTGKLRQTYKYVPYVKKDKCGYEEPNGTYGRKENVYGATFKTNRLSWEATVRIYENNTDPSGVCPIVGDYNMYRGTITDTVKSVALRKKFIEGTVFDAGAKNGTQNNLAKLFLLCYQMTNPVFEAFYGELSDVNGMFEAVPMKDASGNVLKNKDGSNLTTGKFNYDKYWSSSEKVNANHVSKVYWNADTLLPWHVVNYADRDKLSNYCSAMAPYQIMVDSGTPYNMTVSTDTIRNAFLTSNGDSKLDSTFDSVSSNMPDNQYGYEVYDYFDSINGSDPRPGTSDLTMADCLNYLLNPNVGPSISTEEYKILELQPSPKYENVTTFWKPLIATYTNSITTPVVETMTTSEFIGVHVECISEYDLVYIGMNKDSADMTMKFTSGTNFTYAHTGPKIVVNAPFRGLYGWLAYGKKNESGAAAGRANREKTFVFSGNDLTEAAYEKLKNYDGAKFPIVFSSGFYVKEEGTGIEKIAPTVDGNSNVYKLAKNVSNAFDIDDLNTVSESARLKSVMTVQSKKVEMVFASSSDMPVLFDSTKALADQFINGYDNANRTLRFKFTVKAPAGTSYDVKLYVDANTDGLFKDGTEDINVKVYKADGATQWTGKLKAGETYVVERTITDRIGSIVWKLDLRQGGKVYASLSGVSAIQAKADGSEDETLVVLQIVPSTATQSVLLPTEAEYNNPSSGIGAAARMFYEKINGLNGNNPINGMNITFVRMNQGQVLAELAADPDYLYDNYSMLVLGFADIYDGVTDDSVLMPKIKEFIAKGKAVLYTHDTSSAIGDLPDTSGFAEDRTAYKPWGTKFTYAFRNSFGMDRYGAVEYVDTGTVKAESNKDKPYAPLSNATDLNSLVRGLDNQSLVQGISNGMLYRTYYPNHSSEHKEEGDQDANVNTKKVTRVNVGAITNYPYTIPEEIEIASTHPQYYQLDMENKNIVVWYCLGYDDTRDDYEKDYFKVTPNDVRNNYYIYNIGNVTYSGMGHIAYYETELDMEVCAKEIELFVNTFVAAYRAAAKPLTVEITNDDATKDAAGDYYLCVDVDSSNPKIAYGNDVKDEYKTQKKVGDEYQLDATVTKTSKRVYFRLVNTSSYGSAMNYSLKLSVNDGAIVDGVQIDGTSKMLAVFDADTDQIVKKDTDIVADGEKVYYVDVPITLEQKSPGSADKAVGKTTLKIEAFLKYMEGEEPIPTETNATILPRGLFDLD